MAITEQVSRILSELTENHKYLKEDQLQRLSDRILSAGHIFVAGAGRSGVNVALITMNPGSSIAELADDTAVLPGVSPKIDHQKTTIRSVQPMGSAFEQMTQLVCDGLVLELMERTGQDSEEMFLRHADFE